jgi:ABC-type branched-subunit amino acid transport system substrate-binding protein
MRALAALLVATVACTSPAPAVATPTLTPERGVLTVSALLDLSGPRAAVGIQQRNALTLWTEQRARTGIPVKVHAIDVAGSDAKLLIELKRAATEEMADAVVVGAPVAYDETLGRAVDLAALPVLFTQPLDPSGPGASWTFALAPSLSRIASAQIDDALRRDVLVPSIVLTDGRDRVDPMARALAAEAERRRLDPLTRIAAASDGSVPPVVRSSLSVLRSVHCLAPVSVCSAVAREARSIGSAVMIYLPYVTSTHDHVRDDRDLAMRAVWPSTRTLIPLTTLRAQEDHARAEFLKNYGARWNARPDIHAAIAYDALSLLAAVADNGGADDRVALRNRLGAITMPLIASTYAFGDGRRGPDPSDLAYFRWDSGAPAIAPTSGTVAPTPTPSPTPARAASPPPTASP